MERVLGLLLNKRHYEAKQKIKEVLMFLSVDVDTVGYCRKIL